ncbi:unnamed protein product [Lactuca virosa]|uniref:ABC1 atypical kinase-like domain-containing protein n=1 Tax=Lactuca virosa TaxID=75947 RepID=A0AAU9MFQ4_9ASTR|nr:unnamed protein product [Lactuca virosa]
MYSHNILSNRGFASTKNTFSRNYSIIPSNNTITHHAQIAWKRLSKNSYQDSQISSINKIAQAFTLALTCSYIVLPGIFALNIDKGLRSIAQIHRAFGRKISEIFDDFEEIPVASGSIAQIHRASLKYKYQKKRIKPLLVAVKVRHIGVGESIRRDFDIINVVAKMSKFIPTLNWLRLDESVQQFVVFMMPQVDLAREAAHLSRFIYNFRSWKDVSFPKPVYPLVHHAVLVETFEHGERVSRYVDDLEGHVRLKSSLAHSGTHAVLKMLLVDNFIHADMHPGNILVRSKSSRKGIFKSKPHVIFLDVGMTAELSKSDQVNLLEFFKALACRDGRIAAECTLKLSIQQNFPDPQAFIKVKKIHM